MNQVKELRHDRESCNVALGQRAQEFRRVESFQIHNPGALDQRHQQIGHLGQDVKQRQHAEKGIAGPEINPIEYSLDFAKDVGMGQHHALGVGGSTGGVDQAGEIVIFCSGGLKIAGPAGEDRRQVAEKILLSRLAAHAVGIHQHDAEFQFADGWPRDRQMFSVAESCRGAGVFQEFGDLIVMKGGIERHHCAAGGDDSQICRDPSWMVIGKDGEPRSARELAFDDPPGHGLGHAVQLAVSAAFELIVPLEFDGDIVRPSLDTLDEAVVERGHGSVGVVGNIHEKKPSVAALRVVVRNSTSVKFQKIEPAQRDP